MKKKFMAAVLSTVLLIGSMAGCGKADLNDSTDQPSLFLPVWAAGRLLAVWPLCYPC